jgi:hypothetical protein
VKCNHEKYLEQEERSCRQIARSMNSGTQAEQEWLKTAEAILARRREHLAVCKECNGGEKR